ncbi:MAG: hypothetical protein K8R59_06915 [Thermoanaerobaculales bacterium]|nr:hypothetical protein [Thermoanaerobaculales bacterium]
MSESPEGWDRLSESAFVDSAESREAATGIGDPAGPSLLSQMAAAWADLVAAGTMTTATLAAVVVTGKPLTVSALPWAVAVGCAWWCMAAALCVRVRRGTPGMLVAGFVYDDEVAGPRVGWTVGAAFFAALLLGVPLLPGGRSRSLLTVAAGRSIKSFFA